MTRKASYMTETERTIRAILKYTGHSPVESALFTVHTLAQGALEEYQKERALTSLSLIQSEVEKVEVEAAVKSIEAALATVK